MVQRKSDSIQTSFPIVMPGLLISDRETDKNGQASRFDGNDTSLVKVCLIVLNIHL